MDQFQPPSVPPGPANQPQNGEPEQPNRAAPSQPQQSQPPYGAPQPPYGQQPAGQPPYGQPQPPAYGQPVNQAQPPYPGPQGQPQQQPPYAAPQPQAPYGAPQSQAPYGQPQFPAYPGNYTAPQLAEVERPQSIKIAVLLMYVGAALALIGGIFGLFTVELGIQLGLNSTDVQLSAREYEAAATIARVVAYVGVIFGIVVGTGLWIWMAMANNAGRKWARILATVFAAIGIIGGLVSLISNSANHTLVLANMIFGILTLIVSVAALVYLWLKPSTEYYNFKSQKITY